ncbi:MAG: hypothetical protein IKG56_05530 [Clostridia bacterium]|nr:hypothetical protein [Clostridia bacterium]
MDENNVDTTLTEEQKDELAKEVSENGVAVEQEINDSNVGVPLIKRVLSMIPTLGLAFALGNINAGEVVRNIGNTLGKSGEVLEQITENAPKIAKAIQVTGDRLFKITEVFSKNESEQHHEAQDSNSVKQVPNAQSQDTKMKQAAFWTQGDDKISNIMQNARVNENGKVVGIDVSESLPADELRKMLTTEGIPSTVMDQFGTQHDISDLAGKIDYVMIKIGVRGYGGPGNFADIGDSYLEQAKVCEELGIPYGFYYYSTAISDQEAEEEVSQVKERLDRLRDTISTDFFLMPLTLDVEQCEGSRLCGRDVTDVAAEWANKAEEVTGKKVLLYTGGRDVSGPEKILDISRFNAQLRSGPTRIWTPGPRKPDGSQVYQANQNHINNIVNEGGDIAIIQSILDQSNPQVGFPSSDIDIMDKDVFEQMMREGPGVPKARFNPLEAVRVLVDDKSEEIQQIEDEPEQQQTEQGEQQDGETKEQSSSKEKKENNGFFGWIREKIGGVIRKIVPGKRLLSLPEAKQASLSKEVDSFRDSLKVDVNDDKPKGGDDQPTIKRAADREPEDDR